MKGYFNMRVVDKVIFYFFPLLLFQFFGFVKIPSDVRKVLCYGSVALLLIYVLPTIFNNQFSKIKYFNIIKWLFLLSILSIFIAQIVWDQSIIFGFNVTSPMLGIVFYFFLVKAKPSYDDIKKFILMYTFIYLVVWIYAWTQAPYVTFSPSDSEELLNDSRGIFRINIVGRLFLVFTFFYGLNKWLVDKEKKYFVLGIVCFIFIIFQVTRQLILFPAIIGLFYFIRNYKYKWLVLCFVSLAYFTSILAIEINEDSFIGSLLSLSERQLESSKSEDDIRIQAIKFFFNDYSPNLLTDLFGNGLPHNKSEYGKYVANLNSAYGYYLSDVGYAKMFIVNGIVGLLLYVVLFVKVLLQKVSEEWYYTKLFILFMFLSNIGADWYAKPDGVILICICFFLLGKKVVYKIGEPSFT